MKTIRISISSPGDVAEERDKARQVFHDCLVSAPF